MKRKPNSLRRITCAKCASEFFGSHSHAKYCSPDCARLGERESWRRYSARNRERRRRYYCEYYRRNARQVIEKTKAYHRTAAGRLAQKKSDDRQKQVHPERIRARQLVAEALRSGRLKKRPCEKCGSRNVHAHHEDYSRPLVVKWLCEEHHRQIHKRELPHAE